MTVIDVFHFFIGACFGLLVGIVFGVLVTLWGLR